MVEYVISVQCTEIGHVFSHERYQRRCLLFVASLEVSDHLVQKKTDGRFFA